MLPGINIHFTEGITEARDLLLHFCVRILYNVRPFHLAAYLCLETLQVSGEANVRVWIKGNRYEVGTPKQLYACSSPSTNKILHRIWQCIPPAQKAQNLCTFVGYGQYRLHLCSNRELHINLPHFLYFWHKHAANILPCSLLFLYAMEYFMWILSKTNCFFHLDDKIKTF